MRVLPFWVSSLSLECLMALLLAGNAGLLYATDPRSTSGDDCSLDPSDSLSIFPAGCANPPAVTSVQISELNEAATPPGSHVLRIDEVTSTSEVVIGTPLPIRQNSRWRHDEIAPTKESIS